MRFGGGGCDRDNSVIFRVELRFDHAKYTTGGNAPFILIVFLFFGPAFVLTDTHDGRLLAHEDRASASNGSGVRERVRELMLIDDEPVIFCGRSAHKRIL